MRILLFICLLSYELFGAWVMFSDGEDTYIYNNINGDIYIRHKKGGKNYEDNFIKMPSGVVLKNSQEKNATNAKSNESQAETINKAEELKNKFQDLQNNMIDKIME